MFSHSATPFALLCEVRELMDVSAHVVDMLMWFLKFDGVRYAKK